MKWVLFSMMRKNSKRVPGKLLQRIWTPIEYVALGEWAAHLLRMAAQELSLDYYVGFSTMEFPGLAGKHPTIERSHESLATEDPVILHQDIPPRFDGYDWALQVNACCPLLTAKSIRDFMASVEREYECDNYRVHSAFEETGFVYVGKDRLFPPMGERLTMSTKANRSFLTPCHAFAAIPAKCVGKVLATTEGCVSVGPRRSEFLDVDTYDDLDVVRAVCRWKNAADNAMME